jgi:hypothetical protein
MRIFITICLMCLLLLWEGAAIALVRISGLTDFNLGSPTVYPTTVTVIDPTICAYNNVVTTYRIRAMGTNDMGVNFNVRSGTRRLPYAVSWAGPSTFVTLTPNQLSSSFSNANRNPTTNCPGFPTPAQLRITLSAAAPPIAGTYTDTLSLTMSSP